TNAEFIASWVSNPKRFRPTTWMPQIFHLENLAPDEDVVRSKWGSGREIKGQEWNDSAVAAAVAFVWGRARKDPLPPIPVQGDPVRGREASTVSGCPACHNLAPFTEKEREEARELSQKRQVTNEHGPSLRGVASKVAPEWLYAWIKDPKAYWPETRMPN